MTVGRSSHSQTCWRGRVRVGVCYCAGVPSRELEGRGPMTSELAQQTRGAVSSAIDYGPH